MEKNNNTWCRICQNWKRVLGHSQSDCPKRGCKNCELAGHVRKECPYPPKIKINTQDTLILSNEQKDELRRKNISIIFKFVAITVIFI